MNTQTTTNHMQEIDVKATIDRLTSEGRLDECFANMLGAIIHIDGICDLLQGLEEDGVLFPRSQDEFKGEFSKLISSIKALINNGIYPDLVHTGKEEDPLN
jgi:hypothetical protein